MIKFNIYDNDRQKVIVGSANGRHPRSERGNLGPNPSPTAVDKFAIMA